MGAIIKSKGVKIMWIRLARWFEWVFGTILMATLTIIVSLEFLDNFNRWALLIGLFLFFVASLVKQFDDAGWFKNRGV